MTEKQHSLLHDAVVLQVHSHYFMCISRSQVIVYQKRRFLMIP
jgi:hypothetical protein